MSERVDKDEARAERARLQKLLDDYEAGRRDDRAAAERRAPNRAATPDRADKVRSRIARLDQEIAGTPEA